MQTFSTGDIKENVSGCFTEHSVCQKAIIMRTEEKEHGLA